jgi:4-amino-4-deoxy-L-arabinose transferase-like glycosyltransferase
MDVAGSTNGCRASSGTSRLDRALEVPRWRFAVVAIAYCLALLVGLGSMGLWGIREKRVAACVADIVHQGHWLLPELRGEPRLEKPPLPYWIIASFSTLAGRLNEWTLRLPGVLCGIGLLGAVWYLGCEAAGPRCGMLAALFLSTALFFVTEFRAPSSDQFLACFAAGALACWWRGYTVAERRGRWWAAAGFCAGAGLLTKGPVALAVMAPPWLGLLAWRREWCLPRSRDAWTGLAIATAIGLAWPAAVLISDPAAWMTWLWELDGKITYSVRHRSRLFYLSQWPVYLFPWSGFGVAAVVLAIRRNQPWVVRFLWLWFFGDLAVFSLATSQKVYYLLPMVPGLAVLGAYVAVCVDERVRSGQAEWRDRLLVQVHYFLLVGYGVGVAAMSTGWWAPYRSDLGMAAGLGLAALCGWMWSTWRRRSLVAACVSGGGLGAAMVAAAYAAVVPGWNGAFSHGPFARSIARAVPQNAAIFAIGDVDPSFWFYLHDRPRALPPEALLVPASLADGYYLVSEQTTQSYRPWWRGFELVLSQEGYAGERWRAQLVRRGAADVGPAVAAWPSTYLPRAAAPTAAAARQYSNPIHGGAERLARRISPGETPAKR